MATNNRRNVLSMQKASNARLPSNDPKRKFNAIPQMSPEAMRAMGMVRDDAKENLTSALTADGKVDMSFNDKQSYNGANFDSNNNENTNFQSRSSQNGAVGRERQNPSSKRIQRLLPGQNNFSKHVANNNIARSRSTLSHTDAPFSMSDNTDSSCNQTTTTSSASVYTTNNSTSQSGHVKSDNNFRKPATLPVEVDPYDDADDDNDEIGSLATEQDFTNGNAYLVKEKSFVLALDKALERKSISRLKGDITDTSRIHKPGTVRALDGGRLANAQEVVVNVCHNDDRQLVFHDDDEESLDTAKEISQIRVNIWMEYNSEFPPDNDVHGIDGLADSGDKSAPAKSHSTKNPNNPSSEKMSAGSRKSQGSLEEAKNNNNTRDSTSKNKNSTNDKLNKNVPASPSRPKSAALHPKSAMSGSSGSSSRGGARNGPPSTKQTPANTRTRR